MVAVIDLVLNIDYNMVNLSSLAMTDPLVLPQDEWAQSMTAVLAQHQSDAEALVALPAPSSALSVKWPANRLAGNVLRLVQALEYGLASADEDAIAQSAIQAAEVSNNMDRLFEAIEDFC